MQPALISASNVPWMPLEHGLSARFFRFDGEERCLQLRIDPGVAVTRHRHGGSVDTFNVEGYRKLEDGSIAGPGDYVHEPAGSTDSWSCHGDQCCIIQISMAGKVDYLDDADHVIGTTNTASMKAAYLAWCSNEGHEPVALGAGSAAAE